MESKKTSAAKVSAEDKAKSQEKKANLIERKFQGVVVSDKQDKTITVRIDTVKMHPKYKKRYAHSKKYKVHDEKNQFKEGDVVTFIGCRPISKDKRWRVIY